MDAVDNSFVSVAAFEPRSLVNGPGTRAVLWVQGCGRRCPGCFNPDFLPREGGRMTPVEDVVGWIEQAGDIEGITFSGGEPFDQAGALAAVARTARTMGLGVAIFTGYPFAELAAGADLAPCDSFQDNFPSVVTDHRLPITEHRTPITEIQAWRELLAAADLLMAGPYMRDRPGQHSLLSSANQRLVHLTDRYRGWDFGQKRRLEFRIGLDGNMRASGLVDARPLGVGDTR